MAGRWRKFCRRTNSSANIFAARETWSLGALHCQSGAPCLLRQASHTDNERNHGCAISTGSFKTLDELLDLPDLDVLLSLVGLLVLTGHGRGVGVGVRLQSWWGREIFLTSEGQASDEVADRRRVLGGTAHARNGRIQTAER